MPLSLEEVLKLLDIEPSDEGLFSQETLRDWMNELIEESGMEWVTKNKNMLKESWEYLQSR